jgi:hypothetical protein
VAVGVGELYLPGKRKRLRATPWMWMARQLAVGVGFWLLASWLVRLGCSVVHLVQYTHNTHNIAHVSASVWLIQLRTHHLSESSGCFAQSNYKTSKISSKTRYFDKKLINEFSD